MYAVLLNVRIFLSLIKFYIMNPILKNIFAVLIAIVVGSAVNMGLVQLGHKIFPVEGLDPNDMEALAAIMPTLDAKYFIFPFLAHAIGTLVAAFIAAKLSVTHKFKFGLGLGFFFLLGGIMASLMIPAPTWFVILDLVVAYIPMALLGTKLAMK